MKTKEKETKISKVTAELILSGISSLRHVAAYKDIEAGYSCHELDFYPALETVTHLYIRWASDNRSSRYAIISLLEAFGIGYEITDSDTESSVEIPLNKTICLNR